MGNRLALPYQQEYLHTYVQIARKQEKKKTPERRLAKRKPNSFLFFFPLSLCLFLPLWRSFHSVRTPIFQPPSSFISLDIEAVGEREREKKTKTKRTKRALRIARSCCCSHTSPLSSFNETVIVRKTEKKKREKSRKKATSAIWSTMSEVKEEEEEKKHAHKKSRSVHLRIQKDIKGASGN